ncbi:hypothetical protein SS1G_14215 [Sclerotinia sclerotiorum 1980 UF-70]|uniref:Uncharacterized protein n=1 Tax=Sclerotinia sclerotiorum (strain ATCC 18683 / 1980 / Ss-1) TaxID=665079 RepID=A7F9D4_SCLS1|nr:hypothetical protein SS1G_14215 [Sclerotinia sclerotiorum 1980 UF-70]EDO00345.1 hypothetical protein SS1G_14215 [Sclerotinia sclerotiorum 1980 UF-70]
MRSQFVLGYMKGVYATGVSLSNKPLELLMGQD